MKCSWPCPSNMEESRVGVCSRSGSHAQGESGPARSKACLAAAWMNRGISGSTPRIIESPLCVCSPDESYGGGRGCRSAEVLREDGGRCAGTHSSRMGSQVTAKLEGMLSDCWQMLSSGCSDASSSAHWRSPGDIAQTSYPAVHPSAVYSRSASSEPQRVHTRGQLRDAVLARVVGWL
jgi:hypothetical protein